MSARIPLAAVIGDPVGHSRSPRLFRHWLDRAGLPGFYVPLHITAADLPAALKSLPRLGFVGANVTIPHKEAVLQLADTVTERARAIGAANTLSFDAAGQITADNTDGEGFLANLRAGAPEWAPASGPAAIIGAGGAARAIVVALKNAGVPRLRLANRSPERAQALARAIGPEVEPWPWERRAEMLEEAQLVVNTTSLGMVSQPTLTLDLGRLAPTATVTDIVYTPLESPLLREAAARRATLR
jgi:Shikimate 5-dehydrogenase